MSSTNALFERDPSFPAAVILFLVENSAVMESKWHELQGRYLDHLLTKFEMANAGVPVKVITLESAPLQDEVPREYLGSHEGLQNIRFNYRSDNALDTDTVRRAVELLSSFKFEGRRVSLHLVIVAATDPTPYKRLRTKEYPWFLVAQQIAISGIYCHLALAKTGSDLSSFIGVFQKVIWLQGSAEAPPPFLYDKSKYAFYFAVSTNFEEEQKQLAERSETEIALQRPDAFTSPLPQGSSHRHPDTSPWSQKHNVDPQWPQFTPDMASTGQYQAPVAMSSAQHHPVAKIDSWANVQNAPLPGPAPGMLSGPMRTSSVGQYGHLGPFSHEDFLQYLSNPVQLPYEGSDSTPSPISPFRSQPQSQPNFAANLVTPGNENLVPAMGAGTAFNAASVLDDSEAYWMGGARTNWPGAAGL
ncbi:hypothetical protein FA15DRAFT_672390 [Coprinopsis marcescibilis]|uniref:Mediator of RNA polymerase II transcription subunit 25 n=1 Tax=Coprinopsis marcescibilis TaxID=230819 RepID=A0A5C3KMW0_COPMA|nr:hypothetical protein FA15DRAFT_672390 [Coprinopsis marcescibilis]